MTKKDFIALADYIREHNQLQEGTDNPITFGQFHLNTLANFMARQNPAFKRDRWLSYVAGQCGPNGGKL
jgi:hypothetical protein